MLRLLVVEALLGLLVLHQLDGVEETGAAHVAHDRQVAQVLEHGAELRLLAQHVTAEVLALEYVEVRQRDGRGDRVPAEGEAVREHRRVVHERLRDPVGAIIAPIGAYADVRPLAVVMMSGWYPKRSHPK